MFYWIVTVVRNGLFDIGILRITRVSVPVVSIGNISVGGTGKTPFVEVIAGKLKSRGKKPAILSRGYGRKTAGYLLVSDGKGHVVDAVDGGDEPVQLASRLNGTPVAVDENRVDGASRILKETEADSIILDDGFQHRSLQRDLNIVLLTAREILTRQYLLPAGDRRETVRNLRRADAVVVSKCSDAAEYDAATRVVQSWVQKQTVGFRLKPQSLRRVSDGASIHRVRKEQIAVVTFAGLGDQRSFQKSAEEFGCKVMKAFEYSDHHWYTSEELSKIRNEYAAQKAEMIVTTEKDLVRVQALREPGDEFLRGLPVYVLEVIPEFIAGEDLIDSLIHKVVA